MPAREALAKIYARAAPVPDPYDLDALWESNRDLCNEILVELADEQDHVETEIRFAGKKDPIRILSDRFTSWQRRIRRAKKSKRWDNVGIQAQCLVESVTLQDLVLRGVDGYASMLAWVEAAQLVWIIHGKGAPGPHVPRLDS